MDFLELHIEIEELFQCEQCEERLAAPIFCCSYGHAVCKDCRDETDVCPDSLCGDTINNNQQTLLNNLVNTFPFKCEFSNYGCKEFSIPDNLKLHEAECDYRTIQCILIKNGLNCSDDITLPDFGNHIESCHDSYIIPYSVNSEYNTTLPKRKNLQDNMFHYRVFKDNELYFLEMIYYDNQLKAYQISVHFIGKKLEASNYMYLIEIENDNTNIMHYKYGNCCIANIMTPEEARKKCPLILFDENDRFSIHNEVKYRLKIMRKEDFNKNVQ